MLIAEEVLDIVKDMLPEFNIEEDKIVEDDSGECLLTIVPNSIGIYSEQFRTMSVILSSTTYELDLRLVPLKDGSNACIVFIFFYPVMCIYRKYE